MVSSLGEIARLAGVRDGLPGGRRQPEQDASGIARGGAVGAAPVVHVPSHKASTSSEYSTTEPFPSLAISSATPDRAVERSSSTVNLYDKAVKEAEMKREQGKACIYIQSDTETDINVCYHNHSFAPTSLYIDSSGSGASERYE